jgi:hypothetical protein
MSQQWIVEVQDKGRPAFLCEHAGELYLTRHRAEAAVFHTELEAKCAFVYVADRYQPRIRLVQEPSRG